MNIILGSQSPRRRELLAGLDIPFTAVSIDCDESFPDSLQGGDIPLYLAQKKAEAYLSKLKDDDLLITADTIVWLNGEMLGKPHDFDDARRMLRLLSGNTHQVYTGVCLTALSGQLSDLSLPSVGGDKLSVGSDWSAVGSRELSVGNDWRAIDGERGAGCRSFVSRTDVTFAALSDEQIEYYINRYKPLDKAGAYGVQEWIGYVGVTRLEGSYFNVMGLPIQRLSEELRKIGVACTNVQATP